MPVTNFSFENDEYFEQNGTLNNNVLIFHSRDGRKRKSQVILIDKFNYY